MPTADTGPTVAEVLADALYEAGVRKLYGLPGDSIVALLDTLRVRGLQSTLVRHERWAARYAQSDAAVNARPSACFAAAGPGMVNLVQGAEALTATHAPVILLTTGSRAPAGGLQLFQEVDESALFRAFPSVSLESDRDLAVAVERIRKVPELRSPLHVSMRPEVLRARLTRRPPRGGPAAPVAQRLEEAGEGTATEGAASSPIEALTAALLASAAAPQRIFVEDPRHVVPRTENSGARSVWWSIPVGSALAAAVVAGGGQDAAVVCPLGSVAEFGAEFATLARSRSTARTIVLCPCPAERGDPAVSARAVVAAAGGRVVVVRNVTGMERVLREVSSPRLMLFLVITSPAANEPPEAAGPDPAAAVTLLEGLGADWIFSTLSPRSRGHFSGQLIYEPDPEVASFMASGHAKLTRTRIALIMARSHLLRTLGGLFDAKADGIAFTALILADGSAGPGEPVPGGIDAVADVTASWRPGGPPGGDQIAAFRQIADTTRSLAIFEETARGAHWEQPSKRPGIYLPRPAYPDGTGDQSGRPPRPHGDSVSPPAVSSVRRLLMRSGAVTLLLGRGAADALPDIERLARALPAAVVTTMLGPLPEVQTWDNYAGRAGESGQLSAYYALRTAALVVRIGVSDRGRAFVPLHNHVIDVNLTPSAVNATSGQQISVRADARSFTRSLTAEITKRAARGTVAQIRRAGHMKRCVCIYRERIDTVLRRRPAAFAASDALLTLNEVMRTDGRPIPVSVDVGTATLWAYRFLESPGPMLWSASYATMGFAVPAAIAASVRTNGPAIAVTGDGGALCTLQAIRAAVRHRAPVSVLVLNNRRLAAVKFEQESRGLPEGCNDLSGFDFAEYARLIGLAHCKVASREALSSVLKRAPDRRKPLLIEVITDPNEIPFPWLPTREQIGSYIRYALERGGNISMSGESRDKN